jgi:hypothetical protein
MDKPCPTVFTLVRLRPPLTSIIVDTAPQKRPLAMRGHNPLPAALPHMKTGGEQRSAIGRGGGLVYIADIPESWRAGRQIALSSQRKQRIGEFRRVECIRLTRAAHRRGRKLLKVAYSYLDVEMLGRRHAAEGVPCFDRRLLRAQTQPAAIENPFRFSAPGNVVGAGFDAAGNLYVAGIDYGGFGYYSGAPSNVLTLLGPGGGFADSYVMKISPAQQIIYVTGIGGSGDDQITSMAVDKNGNVFLAGNTDSKDFPTTQGSFQTASATGGGFVLKLDPTGKKLIYSTYLDQAGTYIYALTIDGSAMPTSADLRGTLPFRRLKGCISRALRHLYQAWLAATVL